jgi:hypothetical protein
MHTCSLLSGEKEKGGTRAQVAELEPAGSGRAGLGRGAGRGRCASGARGGGVCTLAGGGGGSAKLRRPFTVGSLRGAGESVQSFPPRPPHAHGPCKAGPQPREGCRGARALRGLGWGRAQLSERLPHGCSPPQSPSPWGPTWGHQGLGGPVRGGKGSALILRIGSDGKFSTCRVTRSLQRTEECIVHST